MVHPARRARPAHAVLTAAFAVSHRHPRQTLVGRRDCSRGQIRRCCTLWPTPRAASQRASDRAVPGGAGRQPAALAIVAAARSRRYCRNAAVVSSSHEAVIYCADIGSIPNRGFGWARTAADKTEIERHRSGTEVVDLVDGLADDLAAGRGIAAAPVAGAGGVGAEVQVRVDQRAGQRAGGEGVQVGWAVKAVEALADPGWVMRR